MDAKTHGQVIRDLASGKFTSLAKITPAGSLEARKLATSTMLYWRVTINGKAHREAIGHYDAGAPPKSLLPTARGYSVQAAIRAAEALAQQHQKNIKVGGFPAIKAAETAKIETAAEARREAAKNTLEALLADYADHLQAQGRRSHADVRSIVTLHVLQPWPKVAALPASEVTGEQIADMMRRVLEAGKGRTANKLRSYVRAAYQVAKASRSKASIPVKFKRFTITANPAAETEPDEAQNKPDKRPLSADEMRAYWRAIKGMPGFKGAVLRLHLLTGGQRIEQLVNLHSSDISSDSILLYDGKGRPGKPPRPHTVPLIPQAAAALLDCKPQGFYAISSDKGETHLSAITLSHWAVEAASALPDFQTKRLRSGVETMLAAARVSSEIRGRLQSHGIAGVQARHYDGHDYLTEKRQALEKLFRLLEARPSASNVVAINAT